MIGIKTCRKVAGISSIEISSSRGNIGSRASTAARFSCFDNAHGLFCSTVYSGQSS